MGDIVGDWIVGRLDDLFVWFVGVAMLAVLHRFFFSKKLKKEIMESETKLLKAIERKQDGSDSKSRDVQSRGVIELERRIDRVEWDWNRLKRAESAREIAKEIKQLEAEDDAKERRSSGTKGRQS